MDNKDDLLFYNEYEEFYSMVKHSSAFRAYCKDAFGEDFSQDGFSDINQIKMILNHIPSRKNVHVLDVGCGMWQWENAWVFTESERVLYPWV